MICKNQPSVKADFLSIGKAKLHGTISKWLLSTKYSPLETIFRKHHIWFYFKSLSSSEVHDIFCCSFLVVKVHYNKYFLIFTYYSIPSKCNWWIKKSTYTYSEGQGFSYALKKKKRGVDSLLLCAFTYFSVVTVTSADILRIYTCLTEK